MDEEVGCTLGMMLLKTGDSGNIYSARSKVFSVASAEPLPLLVTNHKWLQEGNVAYFPYVEFTLWACVCIKTQRKQRGLLGKTTEVLN